MSDKLQLVVPFDKLKFVGPFICLPDWLSTTPPSRAGLLSAGPSDLLTQSNRAKVNLHADDASVILSAMNRSLVFIFAMTLSAGTLFGLMPATGRTQTKQPETAIDAARANVKLSTELQWTFGSKAQRGWYLYTSLIQRLINSKDNPGSKKFASAVARWQEKAGLKPSGILDEETLYKMIAVWQDARLKDRSVASPEQLMTAPISDFYDPTRERELCQLERRTYAAYRRMVAAAIADRSLHLSHKRNELAPDEKFLKIISAFRSPEYQEKLRRESPNSGTAGLAVKSPHFTGRALDIYVGGDPVSTADSNRALQVQTPVYKWLVRNAERFGFRPYCYEPWHWEYVG